MPDTLTPAPMTKKDAWLYAASWGSYMTAGDPGVCLYGFDERFRVQSEQHRADCLAEMAKNRAHVVAKPDGYESDELARIDGLVACLKSAKLESEPGALDGLDDFTTAYIEALFFTDSAVNADDARTFEAQAASEEEENEGSFPASATAEDLTPESLARIKADCAKFQADNAQALALAYARDGYSVARAGHDFWLTRNDHGAGFWSRTELESDSPEYEALTTEMVANRDNPNAWAHALAIRDALKALSLGQRLTDAAKVFGEIDSVFGDDGRIHL